MHYRLADLEKEGEPDGLGDIEPWAKNSRNVRFLDTHEVQIESRALPSEPKILVLRHSPLVRRASESAKP